MSEDGDAAKYAKKVEWAVEEEEEEVSGYGIGRSAVVQHVLRWINGRLHRRTDGR